MKLTGPASRLFVVECAFSRPGNLSGTFIFLAQESICLRKID
jgi:hypothetical protein